MKEKVLMFGEGNFLRAFAALAIQKLNENVGFDGSIVCLQGTETGLCDVINKQGGKYTVIERGIQNGAVIEKPYRITALNRCINPYTEYAGYLKVAENPDLELIISNTTEFGICYDEKEKAGQSLYKNFPAKLTDFLFKRFSCFSGAADKGLVILPCELIEQNGKILKEIVTRYTSDWKLGAEFANWLEKSVVFCNTLVDRIVSGYPKDEAEEICKKLGYNDALINVCEPFFLWVIETDNERVKAIPFNKCGLDIIITDDLHPYRERKVRILNGAHTMSVLAGHLCGFETVEQLVNDKVFYSYMRKGIYEEIIPGFKGDKLIQYAEDVLERFRNPFLNHKCLSISLNSVSKFKARILPSIKDYIVKYGKTPAVLSFSLAALYEFYKTGIAKDDENYIKEINGITDIKTFLSNIALWGENLNMLPDFYNAVNSAHQNIIAQGIKAAVKELADVR